MQTTSAQRTSALRVLLLSGASVLPAILVVAVAGFATGGTQAGGSALIGGGVAFSFLLLGSVVVVAATQAAPVSATLIAILTYALQFVVLLAAYAAVRNSGAWESAIDRRWLAGGLAVAAVAWSIAQLVGAARVRIPVYELDPAPDGGPASPSVPKAGA